MCLAASRNAAPDRLLAQARRTHMKAAGRAQLAAMRAPLPSSRLTAHLTSPVHPPCSTKLDLEEWCWELDDAKNQSHEDDVKTAEDVPSVPPLPASPRRAAPRCVCACSVCIRAADRCPGGGVPPPSPPPSPPTPEAPPSGEHSETMALCMTAAAAAVCALVCFFAARAVVRGQLHGRSAG